MAELERLRSAEKYVLCHVRQSITPELFEKLIVFKIDERFSDSNLISDSCYSIEEEY